MRTWPLAAFLEAEVTDERPIVEVSPEAEASLATERWRLNAARLLLEEDCMDPWPGTFVELATGGGPLLLAACASFHKVVGP